MSGLEVGLVSVGAIIALIYMGMHVGIALSLVSFLSVALQKGSFALATKLLTLAAADGIANQTFAVIPLFVLMGLVMSDADVGRDSFEVGDFFLRRIKGGLGLATIASNAVFAAVTGVSIASAAVFTKVAVLEMLRFGYNPRFAVGTVAGSSVLGMLIPLMLGATVVVEYVFALPGIGSMAISAALLRDYPVVITINILAAVLALTAGLFVDVAYSLLDPRIKHT